MKQAQKTRWLVLSAFFIALTAVCAQIMLPIPGSPVQFSLQVLAVWLAAGLLPPGWAALSMVGYLLLGSFGAPVFGGFRGGPSVLFGATGGFILAFPLMALLTAWLLKQWKLTKVWQLFGAMAASLIICYPLGALWLMAMANLPLQGALAAAVYPFVLPDLLKAAVAALLVAGVRKRVKL